MFDNLAVIAILVLALWLVSLGVYLYTSRQQLGLQRDLRSLRQRLDKREK